MTSPVTIPALWEIKSQNQKIVALTASNCLVTLMHGAIEMMAVCGLQRREAFEILQPLIWGRLKNIDRQGIPDALTGPIARGGAYTVGRHCGDLAKHRPGLLRCYRTLVESRGALATDKIAAPRALLIGMPGAAIAAAPEASDRVFFQRP